MNTANESFPLHEGELYSIRFDMTCMGYLPAGRYKSITLPQNSLCIYIGKDLLRFEGYTFLIVDIKFLGAKIAMRNIRIDRNFTEVDLLTHISNGQS